MSKRIIAGFIGLVIVGTTIVNAAAPSYKVDTSFAGKDKKGIVYMDTMPDDSVCYLSYQGTVGIIDPTGKEIGSFTPEVKGRPTSIAADKMGKIYIFSTVTKEMEQKVRGKMRKVQAPVSSHCTICDKKGKVQKEIELEGIKQIKAAKVIGSQLAIADGYQRSVIMVDAKTGKTKGKTSQARICCGIFDFCVGPKNTIAVANLGAFKVQSYDSKGKATKSFGQRGKSINEFHGCCNPVSVAYLSNGAIVTAEKSPTRVKVYDAAGKNAKAISGIDELVKGCAHIPMVADSKGNVYLASRNNGMVKCIAGK